MLLSLFPLVLLGCDDGPGGEVPSGLSIADLRGFWVVQGVEHPEVVDIAAQSERPEIEPPPTQAQPGTDRLARYVDLATAGLFHQGPPNFVHVEGSTLWVDPPEQACNTQSLQLFPELDLPPMAREILSFDGTRMEIRIGEIEQTWERVEHCPLPVSAATGRYRATPGVVMHDRTWRHWGNCGQETFTPSRQQGHTALALDATGRPHVLIGSELPGYGTLYAVQDECEWRLVEIGSDGRGLALAFDSEGTLHATWIEWNVGTPRPIHRTLPAGAAPDAWLDAEAPDVVTNSDVQMVIDANDVVYIATYVSSEEGIRIWHDAAGALEEISITRPDIVSGRVWTGGRMHLGADGEVHIIDRRLQTGAEDRLYHWTLRDGAEQTARSFDLPPSGLLFCPIGRDYLAEDADTIHHACLNSLFHRGRVVADELYYVRFAGNEMVAHEPLHAATRANLALGPGGRLHIHSDNGLAIRNPDDTWEVHRFGGSDEETHIGDPFPYRSQMAWDAEGHLHAAYAAGEYHRVEYDALPRGEVPLTIRFEGDGSGGLRSPDGRIDCSSDCTVQVPLGELIDLEPVPDEGSRLESITGNLTCWLTDRCRIAVDAEGDELVVTFRAGGIETLGLLEAVSAEAVGASASRGFVVAETLDDFTLAGRMYTRTAAGHRVIVAVEPDGTVPWWQAFEGAVSAPLVAADEARVVVVANAAGRVLTVDGTILMDQSMFVASFDASDGTLSELIGIPGGQTPQAVALHPDGTIAVAAGLRAGTDLGGGFVADATGSTLLRFDSEGTLVEATGVGDYGEPTSMIFMGDDLVYSAPGHFVTRVAPDGTVRFSVQSDTRARRVVELPGAQIGVVGAADGPNLTGYMTPDGVTPTGNPDLGSTLAWTLDADGNTVSAVAMLPSTRMADAALLADGSIILVGGGVALHRPDGTSLILPGEQPWRGDFVGRRVFLAAACSFTATLGDRSVECGPDGGRTAFAWAAF